MCGNLVARLVLEARTSSHTAGTGATELAATADPRTRGMGLVRRAGRTKRAERTGRTGRAGRAGVCICLYKPNQYYNLQKVEHVAGFKFEHRGPISSSELEEAAARDVKDQISKLPAKVTIRS